MTALLNITGPALSRSRLTLLVAALLLAVGLVVALDFPSSEEPQIQIRVATVSVLAPGLSVERSEQLIARPLEVRARELAEVRRVETTVRPGFVISYITLRDSVAPDRLPIVYQRLRTKMGEAQSQFPQGVVGPIINDEFGRTAVLVLAVTGADYSTAELNAYARDLRDRLVLTDGADQASLHGLVEDRVYVEFDFERLRASGLSPASVVQQLRAQNIILAGGQSVVDDTAVPLEISGDVDSTRAFEDVAVTLAGGGAIRLGDIARIVRAPQEQPDTAAYFNGAPSVMVAVSMRTGISIESFSERLDGQLEAARAQLPAGVEVSVVSNQADVVAHDIEKVGTVFLETVVIVMVVVILFLGFRSGLIVGAIVPMTMLASLVLMRLAEIELHSISIAALIISLGLLVDNGIVIVEDVERRLAAGEERDHACIEAGRTLAIPLLVSCLTVILAFLPLVLAETSTGEYMRALGQVVAITLLISWAFSLTVVPLLCRKFARVHAKAQDDDEAAYHSRFYRSYRRLLEAALRHRLVYVIGMLVLLLLAGWQLTHIPQSLLPPSNRPAIQIPIDLPPGTTSAETAKTARSVSRYLADPKANPDLTGNAIYVGDGGPRFILGLNPPLPAASRAYAVVNLAEDAKPDAVIARLRHDLPRRSPEIYAEPKRFSLGTGDAGSAVFRLVGPDISVLRDKADALRAALAQKPEVDEVKTDAEGLIGRLVIDIDQAKARRAGVSSEDVANSLRAATDGEQVSVLREDDLQVPVTVRAAGAERLNPSSLGSTAVFSEDGTRSALLASIAEIRLEPQPSIIQRRDGQRYVTVTAKGEGRTAKEIIDAADADLVGLDLPAGYEVQFGGEIEDSAEVGAAIGGLLPLCLLAMVGLFVWQFNSFRRTLIILASIPFGIIGVAVGLTLAGASLSFTAILGILALAGIIVNNAILLLERIGVEESEGRSRRDAVVWASIKRFRPIIMTKLVCVLGLVPLMLFGGALWYPMAAGMIGGLLLGTLVTLGLVPILYSWLYPAPSALVDAPAEPPFVKVQ